MNQNQSSGYSTIHNAAATSVYRSGRSTGIWYYRVIACNVAGCSGYSGSAATQVALPPTSAPALYVPSSSGTGSFTVSWSAVSGATYYELWERPYGGSWTSVHVGTGLSLARSKSPSPYGSTVWQYQVRGASGGGAGPWSAIGSITIPQMSGGGGCSPTQPMLCEDPESQPPDPPEDW